MLFISGSNSMARVGSGTRRTWTCWSTAPELPTIKAALEAAGFFPDSLRPDLFRDGPDGSARTRLRLLFAGEKVRETDLLANPAATCSERLGAFRALALPALVQTKLVAFRIVDWVHLLDMLDIGLINETWKDRYPPALAERLQMLIDTPDA